MPPAQVVLDLTIDPEVTRLAGRLYFYKFGSDAAGWSDVDSFLAPKPANPHAAMSIVVTADMGETYEDGSQYGSYQSVRSRALWALCAPAR